MAKLVSIIEQSDSSLKLEWKWGTAVWELNGLVCAVGAFKDHVKINLFKGAQLKDPGHMINAGLDSKIHRSINFKQRGQIDEKGLRTLIQEAVSLNTQGEHL